MSLSSSSNDTLPYSANGGSYSTHDTFALLVIGFSVTAVCVLIIALCDCLCCRRRGGSIVFVRGRPFFVRGAGDGGGGLSPSAVAALPSFLYHRGVAVGGSSDVDGRGEGGGSGRGWAQCAVCLSLVQEGEMVRQLPACMHLFHVGCVDTWLQSHSTCPLCRATVEAPSKDQVPPV
jgi:E3 ubiquitin-protein ligase ATL41